MRVLPPPGPERRRLLILLVLLIGVGAYAYFNYFRDTTVSSAPAASTQSASNPVGAMLNTGNQPAKPGVRGAVAPPNQNPQALKLDQIENQIPDEPEAGRNLFRFGVHPPPPMPKPTPIPAPVYTPQPPPTPTVTPIPLKYTGYFKNPGGQQIAWLVDKSGRVFQAVAGQIVDGQYRLLSVTPTFVEMEYASDKTGRRRIPLSGS